MRERDGEGAKEGKFVYSFALMDLGTRMYVGYAVSVRSEMDAYHKALEMIGGMRLDLKSVRLDKYYSGQSILEDFNENTRIFIRQEDNGSPHISEEKGQKRNVRVLQGAHTQSHASPWLGDFCPNIPWVYQDLN